MESDDFVGSQGAGRAVRTAVKASLCAEPVCLGSPASNGAVSQGQCFWIGGTPVQGAPGMGGDATPSLEGRADALWSAGVGEKARGECQDGGDDRKLGHVDMLKGREIRDVVSPKELGNATRYQPAHRSDEQSEEEMRGKHTCWTKTCWTTTHAL